MGPDHGERVAAAYFAGTAPFGDKKVRTDLPDSFIWETAIDFVSEHGEISVISADGRLRTAAEKHAVMTVYKSLEVISTDTCQEALDELIASEAISENIDCIKELLPDMIGMLKDNLDQGIVNELAWKTVRHHAIPDRHRTTPRPRNQRRRPPRHHQRRRLQRRRQRTNGTHPRLLKRGMPFRRQLSG